MKYIKKFEDINNVDKRKGIYVDPNQILYVIDYLKKRDIRFMLLFGTDDDADDECFLILIEGHDYEKLDYVDEMGLYKDYYMEVNGANVFLNWFEPENIEGEWKIIRNTDRETIETIINSKKYNL